MKILKGTYMFPMVKNLYIGKYYIGQELWFYYLDKDLWYIVYSSKITKFLNKLAKRFREYFKEIYELNKNLKAIE
jgi:hypothetical protein